MSETEPVITTPNALLERRQIYASGTVAADRALVSTGWGTAVTPPSTLELYCDNERCMAMMLWDLTKKSDEETRIEASEHYVGFRTVNYKCRHCRQGWIRFELAAQQTSEKSCFLLIYGILPKQYQNISPVVAAELEASQLSLYHNALECRSAGMGLGALAYLRRVVEESINILLGLLADVLNDSEDPTHREYLERVAWLKEQIAFAKKATAAAAVLPKSFFAGGHNPFARLHDWASGGVHNGTDEECCDVFDEISGLFDALFERLSAERDAKRLYAERLGKLSARPVRK